MKNKIMNLTGCLIALILGILPAFFIVFNSIFSDSGSAFERVITFLLDIAAYLILGLIMGLIFKNIPIKSGICLSVPAIVFVVLYSLREYQRLPLHFAYIVLTISSACLGAYFGSRITKKS